MTATLRSTPRTFGSLRRPSMGPLHPSVLALVVASAPPIVGLGDALLTGVDLANVAGYVATSATALFVASLIVWRPWAFDMRGVRLGGIFVIAFTLTMLLGAPSVFGTYSSTGSAAVFLTTVCGGFALTTLAIAWAAGSAPAHDAPVERRFDELDERLCGRFVTIVVALGIALLLLYLAVSPVLPLFQVLGGGQGEDIAAARERALSQLSSPMVSYVVGMNRDVLLPTAAAMLLLRWRRWGGRKRFVTFAAVAALSLTTAALTLEKSPVGRVALILALTWWIARPRRVRWRTLVVLGALFITFPFFVSRQSNASANSNWSIVSALGERMFITPDNVHYHYISFVDDDLDQLLAGRTIPNLGKLSPGPNVVITKEVQRRIFPDAIVEGNANGSYLSNFYADFGVLGVLAGSLATGLLVAGLDRSLRRSMPPSMGLPLLAVTAVQLVFITSSSLFDTIAQFPFGILGLIGAAAFFVHVWLPMRRPVSHRGRIGQRPTRTRPRMRATPRPS